MNLNQSTPLRNTSTQTLQSIAPAPQAIESLPQAFIEKVSHLKNQLSTFETIVNNVEFLVNSPESQEAFINQAATYLTGHLEKSISEIEAFLAPLSKQDREVGHQYFRNTLGQWIFQCPFSHRSFTKPLGYAGDYELMNMIYNPEILGDSLFAKCLYRYVMRMPGGNAVRNRAFYLKSKLTGFIRQSPGKKRILTVASGPAYELRLTADSLTQSELDQVEFYLLDQDREALSYAQSKLDEFMAKTGKKLNVTYLNMNIKTLILQPIPYEFDFIYSAGLFDYFDNRLAKRAAKTLYRLLAESGTLIIGNFGVYNPSRYVMELAWDWPLHHRTDAEMAEAFGSFGHGYRLEREEEGINLFAVVNRQPMLH